MIITPVLTVILWWWILSSLWACEHSDFLQKLERSMEQYQKRFVMLTAYIVKKLNFAIKLWTSSTGYLTYSSRTCVLIWQVTWLWIGLQLNFVLLITTFWTRQFSQFSTHLTVHISSPPFISLSMKMLW